MKHQTSSHSLLVEIMIAVLFFALCSTVLLEGFVTAREGSSKNSAATDAMIEGRNLVEQLNLSADPVSVLAENGYAQTGDDLWELKNDPACRMEVRLEQKALSTGVLYEAVVTAWRQSGGEDECLITLQSAHYEAGEVA